MNRISLSSALLFALVTPFIMTYRVGPSETPYLIFALIFLGVLAYIGIDLLSIGNSLYYRLKQFLLWAIIVVVIGSAFVSTMIVRHQTAPVYMVHDIIIQQEAAIRFLLHGENPYATTYFGTPLEQWHYSDKEKNPALYHFVMEPFYLIFAIPFYLITTRTIGFFDGRFPLLFLFVSLLVLAALLVKDKQKRLLFVTLLAFNPAMLGYTLEGRSDIFMFAFLFAGLFFHWKGKDIWGTIMIALSFTVKQSVWPLFPFYLAYLYWKEKTWKKVLKILSPFILVFAVITVPFFLWNPGAFLDSTVFYLSGTSTNSYPISGYGFGALLHQFGFIKNLKAYYPFVFWQAVVTLPLLIVLLAYMKKRPGIKTMLTTYGIFLFVYWYFSRYFNNSHVAYLTTVFLTAYFWPESGKVFSEEER